MKRNMHQNISSSPRAKLGVAILFSKVTANTDREVSRRVVWTQRIGLAARSVPRLGGGIVGLIANNHVQSIPYGEGMWRKQMVALSLHEGVVGGVRDLIRAFSRHPARASTFAAFAMAQLRHDLKEETLALPQDFE